MNRNNEGLYGGLWQFPWAWKNGEDESSRETLVRFARSLDLDEIAFEEVHTLKHGVTFRTIRSTFFMGTLKGNHLPSQLHASKDEAFRWVAASSLEREALPSYQKKALVFTSSPAVSPR
jgi:adenine-specific DNA glycosylase